MKQAKSLFEVLKRVIGRNDKDDVEELQWGEYNDGSHYHPIEMQEASPDAASISTLRKCTATTRRHGRRADTPRPTTSRCSAARVTSGKAMCNQL